VNPSPRGARRAFAIAALRLTALFAVVFYGADAWTALRSWRWRVNFAWELAIPYWPAAFIAYFSVLAVPFLPAFVGSDASEIRRWERRMAVTVLAAGLVFVVFPAELGYAHADPGRWEPLAALASRVSGTYDLLPSLHVALTVVTLHAVWPRVRQAARAALVAWSAALVASVLLTHQHHVADVAAGALLGALVCAAGRGRR
jgi:hypothetical protein